MLNVRATLFYVFYVVFTLSFGLVATVFMRHFPLNTRYGYIVYWNKIILKTCKLLCGIDYKIIGMENIPKERPFVVLSNHQSQWETFLLLTLFQPICIVLKQELLKIPGFGWGLSLLKPIAIDRENPKQALRQIREDGKSRLQEGLPVLIFPEGTRVPYGETAKYARSGASLAVDNNVPVIFVAHNAGYFWPSGGFKKFPGTVTISISEAIDTSDKNAKQLTAEAQEWIEAHIAEV